MRTSLAAPDKKQYTQDCIYTYALGVSIWVVNNGMTHLKSNPEKNRVIISHKVFYVGLQKYRLMLMFTC